MGTNNLFNSPSAVSLQELFFRRLGIQLSPDEVSYSFNGDAGTLTITALPVTANGLKGAYAGSVTYPLNRLQITNELPPLLVWSDVFPMTVAQLAEYLMLSYGYYLEDGEFTVEGDPNAVALVRGDAFIYNGLNEATQTFSLQATANAVRWKTGSKITFQLATANSIVPNNGFAISSGAPPTGTVGAPYYYQYTVVNGIGPYTYSIIGGTPPGTIDSTTGLLTSPELIATGTLSWVVEVTDADGRVVTRSDQINVEGGVLTYAPATLNPAVSVGTQVEIPLNVSSGQPPYVYTVTTGTLPLGLAIVDGVITGAFEGSTTSPQTSLVLGITVTDSAGTSAQRIFTFSITDRTAAQIALSLSGKVLHWYENNQNVYGVNATFSAESVIYDCTDAANMIVGTFSGVGGSLQINSANTGRAGQPAVFVFDGSAYAAANVLSTAPSENLSIIALANYYPATLASQQWISTGAGTNGSYAVQVGPDNLSATLDLTLNGVPVETNFAGQELTNAVGDFFFCTLEYYQGNPEMEINATASSIEASVSGSLNAPQYPLHLGVDPSLKPAEAFRGALGMVAVFNDKIWSDERKWLYNGNAFQPFTALGHWPTLTLTPAAALSSLALGESYSNSYAIAGGSGVYINVKVSSGTLPPGLILTFDGIETLSLSGVPTESGSYSFTLQVVSTDGQLASVVYTNVVVALTPSVITDLPMSGTAGATSVTDTTGRPWTVAGGAAVSTTVDTSGAIQLNGTDAYLSTPLTGDFNFAGKSYTAEIDIYPQGTYASLLSSGQLYNRLPLMMGLTPSPTPSNNTPPELTGTVSGAGLFGYFGWMISGEWVLVASSVSAIANTWNTIKGIYDEIDGELKIFVNGQFGGSLSVPTGPFDYTDIPDDLLLLGKNRESSTSALYTLGYIRNLLIEDGAAYDTLALPQIFAGAKDTVAYSASIPIIGGNGSYSNLVMDNGSLPTGLSLTLTTNSILLSGTPSEQGSYSFTLSLSSGDGQTVTETFTVVVAAPWPTLTLTGTLTSPIQQNVMADEYQLTIAGGELPYSSPIVQSGQLPPGTSLSIYSGTQVMLSGKPTTLGTYDFTVSVSSADGQLAVSPPQSVVVTYQTLYAGGAFTGTAYTDIGYSSSIPIVGGNGVYSAPTANGTLPPGLALSISGSNLVLSGTPTSLGDYSFTASVSSGDGQTTSTRTESLAISQASYEAVVLSDNPLGYWKADEATGTVLTDSSPNGNNGTYNPQTGVVQGAPPLRVGSTGCLQTTQQVNIAASITGLTEMTTVANWALEIIGELSYLQSNSFWPTMAALQVGNADEQGDPGIYFMPSQIVIRDTPDYTLSHSVEYLAPAHAILEVDGTTVNLYVNGALVKSLTEVIGGSPNVPPPSPPTSAIYLLGCVNYPASYSPIGRISDIAFYPTALGAAKAAFHAAAAQIYAPLIITASPNSFEVSVGVPASAPLLITGGSGTYTIENDALGTNGIVSGSLPTGMILEISGSDLLLGGTPTTLGNSTLTVGVVSSDGQRATLAITVSVVQGSYEAAVLADSPLGYWLANETSGTTLTDVSGNGNNGVWQLGTNVLQGGPVLRQGGGPSMQVTASACGGLITTPTGLNAGGVTFEAVVQELNNTQGGSEFYTAIGTYIDYENGYGTAVVMGRMASSPYLANEPVGGPNGTYPYAISGALSNPNSTDTIGSSTSYNNAGQTISIQPVVAPVNGLVPVHLAYTFAPNGLSSLYMNGQNIGTSNPSLAAATVGGQITLLGAPMYPTSYGFVGYGGDFTAYNATIPPNRILQHAIAAGLASPAAVIQSLNPTSFWMLNEPAVSSQLTPLVVTDFMGLNNGTYPSAGITYAQPSILLYDFNASVASTGAAPVFTVPSSTDYFSSSISYVAVVKLAALPAAGVNVGLFENGNNWVFNQQGFNFNIGSSGQLILNYWSNPSVGDNPTWVSPTSINTLILPNVAYIIGLTINTNSTSTVITMYLNGKAIYSATGPVYTPPVTGEPLSVGSNLNGLISLVATFNYALTDAEHALIAKGSTPLQWSTSPSLTSSITADVTNTIAHGYGAYATNAVGAGKWQCEMVPFNSVPDNIDDFIGIGDLSNPGSQINAPPASSAVNAVSLRNDGQQLATLTGLAVVNNNGGGMLGWTSRSVVGMAIDLDSTPPTVSFYVDGVMVYQQTLPLGIIWYPLFFAYSQNTTYTLSRFLQYPLAGYSQW